MQNLTVNSAPPAASMSASADGTVFVPARQGCLELQSEQWCVNALEVVKGKTDGWGSQTSAGGQNSWAQDASGTNLSSQAHRLPASWWQVSRLQTWVVGELEPLEARGNFEKVLGGKQPLRLLLRKRGPFSNAPKRKYT